MRHLVSMRAILLGATIMVLGSFYSSASAQCLKYWPAVVTLTGTLRSHVFAGPPNYESIKRCDRKESAIILKLVTPTCTTRNDPPHGLDYAATNVRKIQFVVT